jgi:peptidoglycan/xylan/chitin deacetylase (PgdA/CDA1 family)
MIYPARTPAFIQYLFPGLLWRRDSESRELYLTFDDGPVPGITPWVLDMLRAYHARATFFCVGQNVARHPEIYEQIISEGHAVGNHTYHHISGWSHDPEVYMEDVSSCAELVQSDLFRPPYGRLRRKQARALRDRKYRIVMWDILSGDFDMDITPDQCYHNVVDNASPGSIIVFHDSLKAERHLRDVLPRVLEFFRQHEFVFMPLKAGALPVSAGLRKTA